MKTLNPKSFRFGWFYGAGPTAGRAYVGAGF